MLRHLREHAKRHATNIVTKYPLVSAALAFVGGVAAVEVYTKSSSTNTPPATGKVSS